MDWVGLGWVASREEFLGGDFSILQSRKEHALKAHHTRPWSRPKRWSWQRRVLLVWRLTWTLLRGERALAYDSTWIGEVGYSTAVPGRGKEAGNTVEKPRECSDVLQNLLMLETWWVLFEIVFGFDHCQLNSQLLCCTVRQPAFMEEPRDWTSAFPVHWKWIGRRWLIHEGPGPLGRNVRSWTMAYDGITWRWLHRFGFSLSGGRREASFATIVVIPLDFNWVGTGGINECSKLWTSNI